MHLSKKLPLAFSVLLAAEPALAETPFPVEYVTAAETVLTFDAALTGSIAARDTINIGFKQGGRIIEVAVKEGDKVARGQELARTDPTQQEQSLMVARAKLATAVAQRDQARQTQTRAEGLLEAGVGTRASLDNALQQVSAAEGALTQARTALDQAERAVADTTLISPADAIVISRRGEVGQIVGAAQPVIAIARTEGIEAVFQTPDLPHLKDAIGLRITLLGLDTRLPAMEATIREISPLVDPHTGAVTVRATIKNAPADVALLGAAVRGTVHFPVGRGIALPWTALTSDSAGPAVWLIGEDMTARLVPITIARFTTDSVIVASGVSVGDRVIGTGSHLVYPGLKVAADEVEP